MSSEGIAPIDLLDALAGAVAAAAIEEKVIEEKTSPKSSGWKALRNKTKQYMNVTKPEVAPPPEAAAQALDGNEKQTQMHPQEGSIWKLVGEANENAILRMVNADPSILQDRDPVGATPLLLLALLQSDRHINIAKRIIDNPKAEGRIIDQYTAGPYEVIAGSDCWPLPRLRRLPLTLAGTPITGRKPAPHCRGEQEFCLCSAAFGESTGADDPPSSW